MTSILEQRLERAIAQLGPDALVVQALRDQVAAAQSGQSAEDIYITGGVNQPKDITPDGP
jgi:hypothetical protein